METLIWKTFKPKVGAGYYGEQIMLSTLFGYKLKQILATDIHSSVEDITIGLKGAIVAFRAVDNEEYIDKINRYISQFEWVIIVITGNEHGTEMYKKVQHPNYKVWLQTPRIHDEADFYLPLGYPTLDYGHVDPLTEHLIPKPLDWFFAGQITHPRRKQFDEVVVGMKDTTQLFGEYLPTKGFGQGFSYPQYVKEMRKAKFVPCPGGPSTPDTFRVYEALELGAIPIVDLEAGFGSWQGNYWEKLFGDVPFPLVRNWNEFPQIIEELKPDWEKLHNFIQQEWWPAKKKHIVNTMFEHINLLQNK